MTVAVSAGDLVSLRVETGEHVAGFSLDSVDYDQSGGGIPAAIPGLQRQLPVTAKLARRMAGPDRDDYLVGLLERPISYQPAPEFDWTRATPEYIGTDDAGRFLRVYAGVICALFTGTQVHAGMKVFPVRVALVIDNTLEPRRHTRLRQMPLHRAGLHQRPRQPGGRHVTRGFSAQIRS